MVVELLLLEFQRTSAWKKLIEEISCNCHRQSTEIPFPFSIFNIFEEGSVRGDLCRLCDRIIRQSWSKCYLVLSCIIYRLWSQKYLLNGTRTKPVDCKVACKLHASFLYVDHRFYSLLRFVRVVPVIFRESCLSVLLNEANVTRRYFIRHVPEHL